MSTETELPLTTTEPTTEPVSKAIVIHGIDQTIIIPDALVKRRDEIVKKAKAIRAVFDDTSRDNALASVRDLKGFRLDADKSTVAALAEINTLPKQAKTKIADFCKETGCGTGQTNQGSEETRLLQLLTAHEADLARQRAAAQKRIDDQKEADRLAEVERQNEIGRRTQLAADALKAAEEAKQRAERARSPQGEAKATEAAAAAIALAKQAEEESEELAIQSEQAALEQQQRERDQQDQLALLSAPEQGAKFTEEWRFEVQNVIAFASQFPDLCDISIKKSKVTEAMNAGTFDYTLREDETCVTPEALVSPRVLRTAPGMKFFKQLVPKISK